MKFCCLKTYIFIENKRQKIFRETNAHYKFIKFEKSAFSTFLIKINSLLLIEKFEMTKFKKRFQKIENKKTQTFQIFINKNFFRFEHVKIKMTMKHNEMIDSEIKNAIHRTNSVSKQKRGRNRPPRRGRGGKSGRNARGDAADKRARNGREGRGRKGEKKNRNESNEGDEAVAMKAVAMKKIAEKKIDEKKIDEKKIY